MRGLVYALPMKRTQRVDYHLTIPQVKALKALSAKTGLTVSELIRRAVDGYLKPVSSK